jgi:starch synthase
MPKGRNVVIVTPELKSFGVRAGGLGPAVEEFAKALVGFGPNVLVVSLLYRYMRDEKDEIIEVDYKLPIETIDGMDVWVADERVETRIRRCCLFGIDFYFLDDGKHTYLLYEGDMLRQAVFLARGTLEVLRKLGIRPDIIHLNDGHTGLVPLFLKAESPYKEDPLFKDTKIVLTIHNAGGAYQQIFDAGRFEEIGVGEEHREKVMWKGAINLTYSALLLCDRCNTVSPDYAIALRRDGEGLKELFRQRGVIGITNGIDVEYWQMPELRKSVGIEELKRIKARRKRLLLQEVARRTGVRLSEQRLTIVVPRRFADQKGFDVFLPFVDRMCGDRERGGMGAQFVVLGKAALKDPIGRKWIEESRRCSQLFPNRFAFIYGFDEQLAKLMYWGGDLLLYPSLPDKEPCGTGYMMAAVNATPTLGTNTGGMVDLIEEFDPTTCRGNGFKVGKEEYSPEAFLKKLEQISRLFYEHPEKWLRLIHNTLKMRADVRDMAREYLDKIYGPLLKPKQASS